ncbi:hypothetical protein HZF24_03600 [Sedimentibacter hydroxybenzoicus DSM 7310]|uniref:Uncharacterized protein n=1 Tax=Sedimentibacter hydroxybenzoicus DSM 7310 TaxID=1123245 RepID=A0A974BHD8_SEDHY|nr:hypothetical protein [Sedimentibacter hydroxybenzoicus]NYB73219.1 hypothetical protein [Sedimentibacter hydroxybenzoicus DSM 7310]
MFKRMISFLLILSILVSYSAFALSNDKYSELKYNLVDELAKASGKSQESILKEHSQLLEDYVKVSKWEEQKTNEFKAKQIEDTNKLMSLVKLSTEDIKNLNNNLGLNQENHNQIQNYIYEVLN